MQKFLIYIAHPYSIPIGRPLDAEIKKRGFEAKWFVEIEATKSKLSKNENLKPWYNLHDKKPADNGKPIHYMVCRVLDMFNWH